MTATAALLENLRPRLDPAAIITDQAMIAPHLEEWRGRGVGATPFLLQPGSVDEAAFIVRLCAEAGVPIVPQGGNTGLVGGQTPQGEILLSLKRMNRIRAIDATADVMSVEAGAILANVHDAAHEVGRRFPLSLGSQGSATIGGLISTNAGGVHVLRFGMMRELVLGIEAVMPDGQVFHGLRSLRKDNTGYDLKQLLIGAEGSLGIITAATLRLFPRPAAHLVALGALKSPEAALDLFRRARDETGALVAYEIMNKTSVELTATLPGVRVPFDPPPPWIALLEFESAVAEGFRDKIEVMLADAIDADVAQDATIAESEKAAADFWSLRDLMAAGHRTLKTPQVSHDTSTPVSAIPAFLKNAGAAVEKLSPGARIVAFGHAGDGNIHYTAIAATTESPFPAEEISAAVHDAAYALGGSISAEHGIGVFRRAELVRFKDPVALTTMRAVKRALDPKNIMNPRVLFEPA